MESESKQVMQQEKQKLEAFDIIKEAVRIFFKNINFIIFTFLTSLPLFCCMVYFENSLQETLVETSEILNRSYAPYYIIKGFSKNYVLELIQLGFIYLVPLHVLDLCSATVTINLASKLRSEEKNMTLKEMLQKPVDVSNLRGTFITSIYVFFLSNCFLIGLLYIVINYYVLLKNLSFCVLFTVISSLAFAKLLRFYLEWSAMWNMSLVISILEGIYGVDALALSNYFSRGCQRRGFNLMLFFFAWGQLLRISCLHMGCYKGGNGIIVQVGLFCVANLLKWVVCMIYFYDCKGRKSHKKVDEELGRDIAVVHE